MKIDFVVNDIIVKVRKNQKNFYYKSPKLGEMYELVINEKESFFHDVQRGAFILF